MIRKSCVLGIAVAALLAGNALASDHKGGHEESSIRVGGGGGPLFGAMNIDVSELNRQLAAEGFNPLSSTLIVAGGGGWGGSSTWSIGGLGGGGSVRSIKGGREAELSLGFGGFLAERRFPLGQSITLHAGGLLGGGGATLHLTYDRPHDLEDAIGAPHDTLLTTGFALVTPTAGVTLALSDWISLEARASYFLPFGGELWEHAGQAVGSVVPMRGAFYSLGFTFGGWEDHKVRAHRRR